ILQAQIDSIGWASQDTFIIADRYEYGKLELFQTMIDFAPVKVGAPEVSNEYLAGVLEGIRAFTDSTNNKNPDVGPKSFSDRPVKARDTAGGIGVNLSMEEGHLKVIAPLEDSPAARAGILANDIITRLDDEAAQGLTFMQARNKIRGPLYSPIRLTIMRKGKDKPIELTIVRD